MIVPLDDAERKLIAELCQGVLDSRPMMDYFAKITGVPVPPSIAEQCELCVRVIQKMRGPSLSIIDGDSGGNAAG